MPIVPIFFGIIVRIYHGDHNPPHFHAQYGELEVIVEIKTGRILNGRFPKRLEGLLEIWRRENLAEILKSWDAAQQFNVPGKVRPLE